LDVLFFNHKAYEDKAAIETENKQIFESSEKKFNLSEENANMQIKNPFMSTEKRKTEVIFEEIQTTKSNKVAPKPKPKPKPKETPEVLKSQGRISNFFLNK